MYHLVGILPPVECRQGREEGKGQANQAGCIRFIRHSPFFCLWRREEERGSGPQGYYTGLFSLNDVGVMARFGFVMSCLMLYCTELVFVHVVCSSARFRLCGFS